MLSMRRKRKGLDKDVLSTGSVYKGLKRTQGMKRQVIYFCSIAVLQLEN